MQYNTVGRERKSSITSVNGVSNWFSSLRRTPKKGKAIQKSTYTSRSEWDLTSKKFSGSKLQLKDELCEVVAEMEALDSADDGKNSNKTKMMSMGRKKFNMDPKKGIEFLIEKGLLQQTAESVAQFLHKGEGLNKTAIGDYLGEKNEFNEKVLQAFVDLHDFRDLILVQALRPLHFCRPSRHICIQ
ncbi:Sec7 domain [Popillia japonica]|uniref:Sec7 domain n=1 Tax=Popillia japonica TaxID=7064 RepID=A0AAW1MKZ8_POPJA